MNDAWGWAFPAPTRRPWPPIEGDDAIDSRFANQAGQPFTHLDDACVARFAHAEKVDIIRYGRYGVSSGVRITD